MKAKFSYRKIDEVMSDVIAWEFLVDGGHILGYFWFHVNNLFQIFDCLCVLSMRIGTFGCSCI